MAKKLDLGALMSDCKIEPSAMQVQKISLNEIDANEANKYALTGIEELAQSISIVGLQQPPVVRAVGGRYKLLAGHRRRAAVESLGWESVDCIVLTGDLDPAMETLILHWTNTEQRGSLTTYESIIAAVEIEEALNDLVARGKIDKLPDKMRACVAAILHTSDTDIARAKAIYKHLSPEFMQQLRDSRINAATAYALSRLDEAGQKHFAEKRWCILTASEIDEYREKQECIEWLVSKCELNDCAECLHYKQIARCRKIGTTTTACCSDCSELAYCDVSESCYLARQHRLNPKAPPESPAQVEDAKLKGIATEIHKRIAKSNSGTDEMRTEQPTPSPKAASDQKIRSENPYIHVGQLLGERMRGRREMLHFSRVEMAGKLGLNTSTYSAWENGDAPNSVRLPEIARALDTSTDYLLGLTDTV